MPYKKEDINNAVKAEIDKTIEKVKPLGLTIEIVGDWIWLDGNNESYKQELEKLRFNWSFSKNRWYYKPESLPDRPKKADAPLEMSEIRQFFGSRFLNNSR